MSSSDLAGWTPINLRWQAGHPIVDWCRLGEARFTDPFFEQTIARALHNPARFLFRRETPLAALDEFHLRPPGVPPSGFIFHLSRCGSTLISQLLAALPQNIVISEAPPLDQVLSVHRRDPGVTRERRIAWFRGMVGAFGQRRDGAERHLFIKLDSWHTLELPLIREAFPDVPWIFLYRDPVEVMVSQHRQRGTQMIPGIVDPRLFDLDPAAVLQMPLDEYCARVLARIGMAAAMHAQLGHGQLVNFSQLPGVVWNSLGTFFGCSWTPADLDRMRSATQANAKNPSLPYADDTAEKQRGATDEIRRLAAVWLDGLYARLESLRLAQADGTVAAPAADASASSSARSQSFTTQSITK